MTDVKITARLAGVFYLAIIASGLTAELALRGTFLVPTDPDATLSLLGASSSKLTLAIALDSFMVICDVILAVLLYTLLKPAGSMLALTAMAFRLMQAAMIGAKLMFDLSAMLGLAAGADAAAIHHDLMLAAYGYDIALIFFGVNSQ